ncbi:DUF2807 domain-containing protein [Brevibacterium casei]|nr:head GIN domain-containing protein [Brevibacterium casei]QQT68768.1 DUF2807 domain-containing protein [Brevibacterium casei]
MTSAVPHRRVDSMNKQPTRTITLVTSLSICIAAFTGCSSAYTGPATTQEREIDTVNAVELDTSGELIVTRGEHVGLTVTAGERVIDRLTSDVEDEVLHLGLDGEPLAWGGDIRYELTIPTLDAVTVLGSGDAEVDFTGAAEPMVLVQGSGSVRASGIKADVASITVNGSGSITVDHIDVQELTTKIDGAGSVAASGTTATQDVEIRGSGEYQAEDLQSTDARIEVRGSGMADVLISGTLDALIDGSGEIRYSGDPKIKEEISGSGKVISR